MRHSTPIATQLADSERDPLRVLVVGAGVAGLTLAQLLRSQGLHPVVVERSPDSADQGYMLALMPLVDPALDRLGVRKEYVARSTPLARYRVRGRTGRVLREDRLDRMLAPYGDYRGIGRGPLLEVLAHGGCPVTWRTTAAVQPGQDRVDVRFASPEGTARGSFDLVVAADGLHSATRDDLWPADSIDRVDTGWGGWVVWTDPDQDSDLVEEVWGPRWLLGSYPVADGVGVFAGGPRAVTAAGPRAFVAEVRSRLRHEDGRVGRLLAAVESADDAFYWPMTDVRADHWFRGRVALLGDGAAGFLPTAGIGAGMAIESAGVLASSLADADPASLPAALAAYERVARPRVTAAHDNSRLLARLVFREGRPMAAIRDLAVRAASVRAVLGPIERLLRERPELAPAPARGARG